MMNTESLLEFYQVCCQRGYCIYEWEGRTCVVKHPTPYDGEETECSFGTKEEAIAFIRERIQFESQEEKNAKKSMVEFEVEGCYDIGFGPIPFDAGIISCTLEESADNGLLHELAYAQVRKSYEQAHVGKKWESIPENRRQFRYRPKQFSAGNDDLAALIN